MWVKWIVCALLLVLGLSACGGAEPTPYSITTDGGTWDLVWSDEFDDEGLPDPKRWGYEVGYIRNNELQYYTEQREENARVEDGVLVIEARKDGDSVPGDTHGVTSASLYTKATATWTYGRVEVRAQMPPGIGTWPAIWMLGANIDEVGWPACGEIDIMEHVGFQPGVIHANIHTEDYNHVLGTGKGASLYIPKPDADFRVYAVEWFEDRMDFFVDDRLYFTYENENTGAATWPFDAPHYLILNLAIGGSWGGQHGVDEKMFPTQYLIDYVRVFELVE